MIEKGSIPEQIRHVARGMNALATSNPDPNAAGTEELMGWSLTLTAIAKYLELDLEFERES